MAPSGVYSVITSTICCGNCVIPVFIMCDTDCKVVFSCIRTHLLSVAKAIGSAVLAKVDVIAFLQENAKAVSSNMLRLALNAESEQIQVIAGKDILDRAGYKPVEQSEVKGTLKISFDPAFEK